MNYDLVGAYKVARRNVASAYRNVPNFMPDALRNANMTKPIGVGFGRSKGGLVYNTSSEKQREEEQMYQKNPMKLPIAYPVSSPLVDFISGIRRLWWLNLIWGILHLIGFIILLIYRCVIVAQGTTKILTVYLVTVFSIFGGSPSLPSQFYPVVWNVNNYLIDIPFIIVFAVASVGCLIKLLSLFSITKDDLEEAPLNWVMTKPSENSNSSTSATVVIDKRENPVIMFDANNYRDSQLKTFYVKSVFRGFFWFRWIEWFISGGILLWGIMTLTPIQDVILLSTLLMVYLGILLCGFWHEWTNQIKLSNVNLEMPFTEADPPVVNRKPKIWYSFGVGVLFNLWLWIVVFLYYGYADNFAPGAYQWYRLTVIPIAFFFYFILIPAFVILWTIQKPYCYEDFTQQISDGYYNSKGDQDVEPGRSAKDPNPDPVVNPVEDTTMVAEITGKKKYWELSKGSKRKIHDFMFYQDWNKNVMYEIFMTSACGICKQAVIWIVWGGMLSS